VARVGARNHTGIIHGDGTSTKAMKTSATSSIPSAASVRSQRRLHIFVHLVEGFGAQRWAKASDAATSSGIIDQLPYGSTVRLMRTARSNIPRIVKNGKSSG
jgi:hypothetical protein